MGAAAGVAAGAIAGTALPCPAAEQAAGTGKAAVTGATGAGRVVAVSSATAFKGTEIDAAVVSRMVEKGTAAFSGGAAADLWKSLFRPEDVVSIKLNCMSRTARPNRALIDAVVEALKGAGVKENNIIVWDRFEDQLERRARLKINRGAEGVRIYGTETPADNLGGYDEKVFYETDKDTPEYRASTGTKSLVTKIITTDSTKIINMPVLKDHNQAGVTACLKNLAFGAINNTARFHKAPMYCSPAIADVYSIPEIRGKIALHVVDALRVCYNGGPDAPNSAWVKNVGMIYVAQDPVACDTIALEVVEKMRAEAGLPDLYQTSGQPVHIQAAAEKGLGVGDRAKIELVAVTV